MNLAEENVAFLFELGHTLTQWAHVENQLRNIATGCFPATERIPIGIGFPAIESFRSKLQFTKAIVTTKVTDANLLSQWEKLAEKLSSLSARRNKIVHYPMRLFIDAPAGRRYALVPWIPVETKIKQSKASKSPPLGSICVRDLAAMWNEFHALTQSLSVFHGKIGGGYQALDATSVLLPRTVPSLRDLNNRIRAATRKRRAPSKK